MSDNIVLIRPPSIMGSLRKVSLNQHPINLLYLAGTLITKGAFKVRIIDYEAKHYSVNELLTILRELNPLVIGITSMTPTIVNAYKIASIIKDKFPESKIIIGGNHASALPVETLEEFLNFDIAVYGEGELTILEVCNKLRYHQQLNGVLGIAYRNGEDIILESPRPLINNLDDIPSPARQLINMDDYASTTRLGRPGGCKRTTELFTSRGCPYSCIFCAVRKIFDKKVRYRSLNNIYQEVRECVEKFHIGHFTIQDDNICLNSRQVYGICDIFSQFQVSWDCDARVDAVDKKMLREMARAGCKQMSFGVESGSARILKLIKKSITLDQIEDAFNWAKQAGIKRYAYFMIGVHPDETIKDIQMTKKVIKKINPDYLGLALMIPYPGTEIYDFMIKEGLLIHRRWDYYGSYTGFPPYRNNHFEPKQLNEIQRKVLRNFYLRPSYILRRIMDISNLEELRYMVTSGITALKYLYRD